MKTLKNTFMRNILFGFLSWLIPFVVSFFFYNKEGLVIDVFLFKSIMIVVGSISASFLLVKYFKKVKNSYVREGMIIGVTWFAINIILDIFILLPMSGMAFPEYFASIGLRYVSIPAFSIGMGAVLRNKVR